MYICLSECEIEYVSDDDLNSFITPHNRLWSGGRPFFILLSGKLCGDIDNNGNSELAS